MEKQVASSVIEKCIKSPEFKEVVVEHALSFYDEIARDNQKILWDTDWVLEDVVQLLDAYEPNVDSVKFVSIEEPDGGAGDGEPVDITKLKGDGTTDDGIFPT